MPILNEQRKRQKNLITVVVLVVIVSISVLYFGRFRQELPETVPGGEDADAVKGAREIQLNLNLLKEARFKELVPYETLSRDISTGRNNPFMPYGASEPVYVKAQIEQRESFSAAFSESTSTILEGL